MSSHQRQEIIGALACSTGAFFLYGLTLAPTIQGFDSAELTLGAYQLGFVHPPGYPLYMLSGHLFARLPLGDIGYRLNLMSAFYACMAIYILFRLLYRQTRNFWAALVPTALLTTTPIFWSQAIRAEVYTLHVFLVTAALVAWWLAWTNTRPAWLFLCASLLGLGMGNHPTTLLLWGAYGLGLLWLEPTLRRSGVIAAFCGLILSGAMYLYFPLRANSNPAIDYIQSYFHIDLATLPGMIWLASGRAFHCLFLPEKQSTWLWTEILRLVEFTWAGMLGFGMFLSIWGWLALAKSSRAWNNLLTVYFAANLVMFLVYRAVDKEVMFLPIYIVLCIWMAHGIPALSGWVNRAFPNYPNRTADIVIGTAACILILVSLWSDFPAVSLRNDRRVYDYSQRLLVNAPPEAVIINHWVTASVIDYLQQVEGVRPDVLNINVDFYFLGIQQHCAPVTNQQLLDNGWINRLEEWSDQGQLCFIEPLHGLPAGYRWEASGECWSVKERKAPERKPK